MTKEEEQEEIEQDKRINTLIKLYIILFITIYTTTLITIALIH